MTEPVSLTGVDETVSAFDALGKSLTNDVEPASKVAALAADKAMAIAPVLTGALSSSYAVEERFIVSPLPYSIYVEYGTIYMGAQHIVQRSLDAVADKVEPIYNDWVKQEAERVGFDATG
jgi:HK97 gp10 family phage protein